MYTTNNGSCNTVAWTDVRFCQM